MINGKPHPLGLAIGWTAPGERSLRTEITMPVDEAITQTFGILAKKGAGKSYTASVMAEEMLKNNRRIIAIDPTGAWWGLRSSATGKSDGYPVVIFGGLHADIPLNPLRGRELGEFAAAPGPSIIIDLSDVRKGQMRHFAADLFEALYEGKNRQRDPVHLFIDEADLFAPQRVMADEARMVGAVEDIVRRGRIRGLGTTLITQRSAVINWDVLSQVDTLLALRTTAPLDRKRMAEWLENHADRERAREVLSGIDSLPTGIAWLWSPGWLNMLVKVEIRARDTFNSGATPKGGAPIEAPTQAAKVDLGAIRASMEATFAEAEANDPKKLKARIVELEKALSAKPKDGQTVEIVKLVERPILQGPELAAAKAILKEADAVTARLTTLAESFAANGGVIADSLYRAAPVPDGLQQPRPSNGAPASTSRPVAAARPPAPPVAQRNDPVAMASTSDQRPLGKAERLILAALAQFREGKSQSQLGIITGYSADGGGFRNALGALRARGLIEGPNTHMVITAEGLDAVGPVAPAPTGTDLLNLWLAHSSLGKAERAILRVLAGQYPAVLSSTEVATQADPPYAADGGGFRNALGKLRTLGLIEGPNGGMRASADLV